MKCWYGWLVLCAGAGLLWPGCRKPEPVPPPSEPTDMPTEIMRFTNALPRLRTMQLWLGAQELTAELALAPREIATGMMFRTNMLEQEAMLFVFAQPHQASFYMKNTRVPLSCAYLDPEGVIREIRDLKPFDESAITARTDQVQFVLEVNQGWFARYGVSTGMVVRTEHGSLRETFFGTR